jgi:hypothetical protein
MNRPQNVSNLIVLVLLNVAAHGLTIVRMWQRYSKFVIPGGLWLAHLSDVLAPFRLDQSIDRIIDISV